MLLATMTFNIATPEVMSWFIYNIIFILRDDFVIYQVIVSWIMWAYWTVTLTFSICCLLILLYSQLLVGCFPFSFLFPLFFCPVYLNNLNRVHCIVNHFVWLCTLVYIESNVCLSVCYRDLAFTCFNFAFLLQQEFNRNKCYEFIQLKKYFIKTLVLLSECLGSATLIYNVFKIYFVETLGRENISILFFLFIEAD